jgi:hypothetical protein
MSERPSRLDDPIASRLFDSPTPRLDALAGPNGKWHDAPARDLTLPLSPPPPPVFTPPFDQRGSRQEDASPEGEGDPVRHQWRATASDDLELAVVGGVVTSQAGFAPIEVADVPVLVIADSGFVILTITRDADTRAVTGTPAISFYAGALPESDYNEQVVPLAKVTVEDESISEILPLKFEELHIFEDLAVVNGEFMLADLLLASRNIYSLPPPPGP